MWLNKQIYLKMVRFKDWTENECKSRQCSIKNVQEAWITVGQDYFKNCKKENVMK